MVDVRTLRLRTRTPSMPSCVVALRMRTSIASRVVGALLLTLAGCGGGGTPTGPEGVGLADLAGGWTATVFEFSQDSGPAFPPFDLVAEGFSVTLDIESNGRFVLATTSPQGVSESDPGTLSFDPEAEDFMLVTFDDEPGDESEFFFVIVSEDSFRLIDNTGEGEFDFDGDGVDERARINSTWVRS